MNRNQGIIILVILAITALTVTWQQLQPTETKQTITPKRAEKVKEGTIRQFSTDDVLKTEVNYKNGIKHGISYLYHTDGKTVLLEMPYMNGKREGTSRKYYESGALYASTSYKNDLLHGPRKTFYSSGLPKAIVHYAYGYPGTGTEEYFIDGSKKVKNAILFKQEGTIYFLDTKEDCERKRFYIGNLIDDRYYHLLDKNLKSLPISNGKYYVDIEVYTPSYLQYQDIVCVCESSQGNPIVLKEKLVID